MAAKADVPRALRSYVATIGKRLNGVFPLKSSITNQQRINLFTMYITDLELEVDRLRKQLQLICLSGSELCNRVPAGVEGDQGCDNLRALIEDARADSLAAFELDRIVPINLAKFIDDIFRWQQRFENRPEARLVLSLSCEQMNWFPGRLRHILQNLIGNAIRFGDPNKGENRVNITAIVADGSYEIRISDNGMGMGHAQLTHLLEPAYQSSEIQNSKPGVGLPIVKHLVEQSGGELSVGSGEGMGSCFVITLPMFEQGDFLE